MSQDLIRLLKPFRTILLCVLAILAVVYLLANFLVPSIGDITEVRRQSTDEDQRIAALKKKLDFLSSLNENELKTQIQKLSLLLPEDKNIPYLLTTLDFLASDTDINFDHIDFKSGTVYSSKIPQSSTKLAKNKEKNDSNFLEIATTFIGTKEKINLFIGKLYALNSRLFIPVQIGLKVQPDSPDQMKAYIVFNSYFSPITTNLGEIESALPDLGTAQKTLVQNAVTKNIFAGQLGETSQTPPKSDLFNY